MITEIEEFLSHKRFALIGASRDPKHFSRLVMADYTSRGWEVLPVNPNLTELDGRPVFREVKDIVPLPNAALLMPPTKLLEQIVNECLEAGVQILWLVRGTNDSAVRSRAVELCQSKNVKVIDGACPLMYLQGTAFPHKVHGWIWKLVGMWGR